jgi:membrane protein implicated in regulation of membrane protease activity
MTSVERGTPRSTNDRALEERELMLVWPILAVIGFLALTAFIVVLGTSSTNRYEQERRAQRRSARLAGRSVGVVRAT